MTDRDDIDPADWLAQQFGDEPTAPESEPVVVEPVVVEPVVVEPAVLEPVAPDLATVPVVPVVPVAPEPVLPVALPPAAASGAPFQWGLTPGGDAPAEPESAAAEPVAAEPAAEPAVPEPAAPAVATPTITPPPLVPPADIPTVAMPTVDAATTALPQAGQELDTVAFDVASWHAASLDPALDGVTEVIEAELVGLPTPEGEGVQTSAIDSLFGDTSFQEYEGQALIPAPPRSEKTVRAPRAAMPTSQKVLLWVAGGLLAALALVGLFLLGTKLSDTLGAAPAVTASPSPSPTPTPTVLPVGPVAVGDHAWNDLLGGECLKPWESAWQETYTVVDCATPHPAQMVFRGTFDDAAGIAYPGVEELQKRINLLCTPTSVIDYSIAGLATDIQVTASFAADADDWSEGNRTFFCFVNRSSGQDLTASVAVPQVAPAPAG